MFRNRLYTDGSTYSAEALFADIRPMTSVGIYSLKSQMQATVYKKGSDALGITTWGLTYNITHH